MPTQPTKRLGSIGHTKFHSVVFDKQIFLIPFIRSTMLLIERDATLFRTVQKALHHSNPADDVDEEYVLVNKSDLSSSPCSILQKLRETRKPSSFGDDDCCSLASSIVSAETACDRRVSFIDPLVTEIHTRPYTPRDEISNLFYSCEETAR